MGSDGELEPEVDDNKVITEEETAEALELKALANKAFKGATVSQSSPRVQMSNESYSQEFL